MTSSTLLLAYLLAAPLLATCLPSFGPQVNYSSPFLAAIVQNIPAKDQCVNGQGQACYIPDGHIWSLPVSAAPGSSSSYIVHTTYDWSFLSNRPGIDGIYGNYSVNESTYDPALLFNGGHGNGKGFLTLLPNASFAGNLVMPTIDQAGFRNASCSWNAGDCWDSASYWLYQAFRVANTSRPNQNVDPNWLIGFAHNEDDWKLNGQNKNFKHVGVRYSNDNGRSWTRSVPILTRQKQVDGGSGTGDFAVMWNYKDQVWQAFTTEEVGGNYQYGLIMAYSEDKYARPGTWKRIEPRADLPRSNWSTAPDYHLPNSPYLYNTSLTRDYNKRCSNPSIIYDALTTKSYHMICQKPGGGLRYSTSSDGWIWSVPVDLSGFGGSAWYPSVIGSGGDAYTEDGKAKLWYWNTTGWNPQGMAQYRSLFAADLVF